MVARARPPRHPAINEKWCKKCGICFTFCPKKVFDLKPGQVPQVARPEDCNACDLCVLRCPDFAVALQEGEHKGE